MPALFPWLLGTEPRSLYLHASTLSTTLSPHPYGLYFKVGRASDSQVTVQVWQALLSCPHPLPTSQHKGYKVREHTLILTSE